MSAPPTVIGRPSGDATGGRPSVLDGARSRVLYISYHGLGTALVRSQVLPYVRGLAADADFHLLTYEGASDEAPPPPDEVRGIALHRATYHKRPNLAAKTLDIAVGIVRVLWIVFRHDIQLLHARSHVAAAIAATVSLLSGRPWIFDMRGFLADEFVEAGAWRSQGWKYRLVRAVERALLRRSDAIIVLTERALVRLRSEPGYARSIGMTPISVIPCAVDLDRYRYVPAEPSGPTLVYIGSVGTWYLLADMLLFFRALVAARPAATLLIVNRSQRPLIEVAIRDAGLGPEQVGLIGAEFDEIPAILARCAAGIVLLRAGLSKLGSSPIKLSEYLACGLPVVVNESVGDAPRLLSAAGCGVVLTGTDEATLAQGAAQLVALIDEGEGARRRARALAESVYSLGSGVEGYRLVYEQLLSGRGRGR